MSTINHCDKCKEFYVDNSACSCTPSETPCFTPAYYSSDDSDSDEHINEPVNDIITQNEQQCYNRSSAKVCDNNYDAQNNPSCDSVLSDSPSDASYNASCDHNDEYYEQRYKTLIEELTVFNARLKELEENKCG